MMKHWLSLLLAVTLLTLPFAVLGEEPLPNETQEASAAPQTTPVPQESPSLWIEDQGLKLGGSSVHYPVVKGIEDEQLSEKINGTILMEAEINQRLSRMALLMSSPVKLKVTYDARILGDVLSCAVLADGAVETTRGTQVWRSVNLDLRTGEAIPFSELFTDLDAAMELIEDYLTDQVAVDLSAHLSATELLPVSETFTLSPTGLTLYYPVDRLCLLSGRAGTVTLLWQELRPVLDLTEGSVLARLGAGKSLAFGTSPREEITQAVSGGQLPGIPAALGQEVAELIDTYRPLTDPDLYEGGRMVALEDGAFRQVWLLTDALHEKTWEGSVVQGIRADRLTLLGLCTGETTQAQWREALGEPDATVTVDEARAEGWRIVPGSSDYYALGKYRLRLHADESGILRTVFLTAQ